MTFSLIGILGGSFDPIHNGHIEIARQCLKSLPLEKLHLLPCKQAPYQASLQKKLQSTAEQRLEMIKLALSDVDRILIDKQELQRNEPSYTVLSLQTLKKRYPNHAICWIMGLDAFASLSTWYNWQDILTLSHIILCNREQSPPLPTELSELLSSTSTDTVTSLEQSENGKIYKLEANIPSISSTEVRNALSHNSDTENLLPKIVSDYILSHQLYGTHNE